MEDAIKNPLNVSHRCDQCGAQAFALAGKTPTGVDLLFCYHHARLNSPGLMDKGWTLLVFESMESNEN